MLSTEQIAELNAPLNRTNVKSRTQGSRDVYYVEGWHVIAEANRIFGFDGWTSETVELHCVGRDQAEIGAAKRPGFGITYRAKVRITVPHSSVFREGYGAGHGIDVDLGQAHESAIKEAETDARKRALMTFGNPFGLALYDRTQVNVADEVDLSRLKYIEETKASIERIGAHPDPKDLLNWWNSDVEKRKRRDFDLSPEEVSILKNLVSVKLQR